MGTLRGDNGGERSPDGGGLPDLPPEWGRIVIPDDVSALDNEGGRLRRAFRREARRNRWRRRFGRPPIHRIINDEVPALGLPIVIISIAIIATLTSLFALALPTRPANPPVPTSHPTNTTAAPLPDLTLLNTAGTQVRLRDNLPAVLLLVDGCPCTDLISATVRAAGTGVSVIVVARSAPTLPAGLSGTGRVLALADPGQNLRTRYASPVTGGGAAVVLVRGTGAVARALSGVTSVDGFRVFLSDLD